MNRGYFKLGLFPAFLCLIAGLSCGLLLLCYDKAPGYYKQPETIDAGSRNAFFSRVWSDDVSPEEQPKNLPRDRAESVAARAGSDAQKQEMQPEQTAQEDAGLHSTTSQSYSADRQALAAAQVDSQLEIQQKENSVATYLPLRVNNRLEALEEDWDDLPANDVLEDGQDQSPEEKEKQQRAKEQSQAKEQEQTEQAILEAQIMKLAEDAVSKQKEQESRLAKNKETAAEIEEKLKLKGAGAIKMKTEESETKPPPVARRQSVSIAALAEEAAKDLRDAQAEEQQHLKEDLTATEKKFMFQMTDMLAMVNGAGDSGGASIEMPTLSEEEANALDAEEYNSKKAYGAREEDLVTFLQVRQGMPKEPWKAREAKLKAAAEGVPLLTIDIVKQQAKDNLVIVTFANWAYYDFVLNWVAHLRKLGVTNFLVGALDRQTSLGLAALGIPGFQMYPGGDGAAGLTTQDFRSAQENFHRLSRQKVALARLFTDFGYDVLLNDVDTVWLRDPGPYFTRISEVDILIASDDLSSTLQPGDEGLELVQAVQGSLSISVLYLRHSPSVTAFVKEWDAVLAGQMGRVDQIAFNTLVAQYTTPLRTPINSPRLATGPAKLITVGVLPVTSFMNGHTYFVQSLHEDHQVDPYCVHANINEGEIRGKRHRLREAGLWLDTPAYYDSPAGFVQVMLEPPGKPHGSMSGEDMLKFHTESLNNQLAQVRAGLALAIALDRTLIMPKVTCFCDRSWTGLERCRSPGAGEMHIPFTCPLDYIWDPSLFDDSAKEHGPRVDIREYNFLDKSTLPPTIKDSVVAVVPSDLSFRPFQTSSLPGSVSQVEVAPQLAVDDLRAALDAQISVRVLTFTDAAQTFGGFRDADWASAVSKRIARLQGTWCCGQGKMQSMVYGMDASVAGLTAAAVSAR